MTKVQLKAKIRHTYTLKGGPPANPTEEELAEWMGWNDVDEAYPDLMAILAEDYVVVGDRYKDKRAVAKQQAREAALAAELTVPRNPEPEAATAPQPEPEATNPEPQAAPVVPSGCQDEWEQWLEQGHRLIAAFKPNSLEDVEQWLADIHHLWDLASDRVGGGEGDYRPVDEFEMVIEEKA